MDIKATLDNLAAATPNKPDPRATLRNTDPPPPTEKRAMEKRILILQSAVKNKWKFGGFCSTQGHGVRAGHENGNCADKKDVGKAGGHDVNSNHANPSGPGKDSNKGWDAWLL